MVDEPTDKHRALPLDERKPAIRAAQTKNLLDLLTRLEPDERAKVDANVDPEVLERVRRAFGVSWTPMAEHMHFCDELYAVVGVERFVELFRETFIRSMQSPLMAGFFGMIRRISRNSIDMTLRNSPRIYGFITRDVGELMYVPHGPRSASLEMHDWPAEEFGFECWLHGTLGSIKGVMQLMAPDDQVEVTIGRTDPAKGFGDYRVEW